MPSVTRPVRPVLRLVGVLAALLVLAPVAASASNVDAYASYEPQKHCSPKAKPGTLMLGRWLRNHYAGTGMPSISRPCKDRGVSEHKEGRALDWSVNVRSTKERRYAAKFLRKVFATDTDGNTHALARRMGIMYIIWNDHIYSSYRSFTARDYKPCKKVRKCSATARHRNHMHISLSRAGGRARTSFYK